MSIWEGGGFDGQQGRGQEGPAGVVGKHLDRGKGWQVQAERQQDDAEQAGDKTHKGGRHSFTEPVCRAEAWTHCWRADRVPSFQQHYSRGAAAPAVSGHNTTRQQQRQLLYATGPPARPWAVCGGPVAEASCCLLADSNTAMCTRCCAAAAAGGALVSAACGICGGQHPTTHGPTQSTPPPTTAAAAVTVSLHTKQVCFELVGYLLEELRDGSNLETFKRDLEDANVFIGSLIFIEELAEKVGGWVWGVSGGWGGGVVWVGVAGVLEGRGLVVVVGGGERSGAAVMWLLLSRTDESRWCV